MNPGFGSDNSTATEAPATSTNELEGSRHRPRWSVCGASVAGIQHLEKGNGCDDAFAYATAGDVVVVAVADGAGSVTQTSAWGSYTAVDQVVTDVTSPWFDDMLHDVRGGTRSPEELLEMLFRRALESVQMRAQYTGQPLSELATTLAVAVATPELAMFAQIGDGIIALRTSAGIETILVEEREEYVNWTWFIQSQDAFNRAFRTYVSTDVTAFALSTDGMSYKITHVATGAAFVPFFDQAWAELASGLDHRTFAAWLAGIENDQTGDDKTVVLAHLDDEPNKGVPELETRRQSRRPPPVRPSRAPHQ